MTAFKPMLAKDADLDKIEFPLIAQRKLDGIRCAIVDGQALSRTLKPIPNAEIQAALARPEFNGLDGELIVGDPNAEDCYRRTASFVMAPGKTGEPWAFYAFDKWDEAGGYFARVGNGPDLVYPCAWLGYTIIEDAAQLEAYEEATVAAGGEGVIARTPDGPYKFGRSGKTGPLVKIKRFIDFEAEVVGVYEEQHNGNEAVTNALGRTERSTKKAGKVGKGTLGGLIVRALNGPAEGVEFRVGTGFDARARANLWAWASHTDWAPEARLVGKTVKIKSFPIGVKDKPRHPVFLGFRDLDIDG